MAEPYRLTTDLFVLPADDDNPVLYAPRRRFACAATPEVANLLSDLEDLDREKLTPDELGVLELLRGHGILNGPEESPLASPPSEVYQPTQVTLFPTNQCNLRCTYCYASAGDFAPLRLGWPTATAAIERVIDNLKALGGSHFGLGFHGGGEPLFDWPLVQRIVTYAEGRCAEESLKLGVYSATNGVLGLRQLEWIVAHFDSLNISFDGLPDVQDAQRPLPGGKGSFARVDRTVRFLDEHKFTYGLRSTVSLLNVERLVECVDFIGTRYKTRMLHFEPLFYCGRCRTSGVLSPEMTAFADHFEAAAQRAQTYGIRLTYSGSQIENVTNSFCGVSRDSFAVTPDGYITTCFEVTSKEDPRAETFFIGRINEEGKIEVNEEKRSFLHSLTVENLDFCRNCFAKWHCAGDCVTKLGHSDYAGPRGHERCAVNRRLAAYRIRRLLAGTSGSDVPLTGPTNRTAHGTA